MRNNFISSTKIYFQSFHIDSDDLTHSAAHTQYRSYFHSISSLS